VVGDGNDRVTVPALNQAQCRLDERGNVFCAHDLREKISQCESWNRVGFGDWGARCLRRVDL